MFKLFVLAAFVALAAADVAFLGVGSQQGQQVRILNSQNDISPEGNYNWSFDAENGISAQEQGQVRQVGSETPVAAQGSYRYTSPEGLPVEISYVADENGFQPSGNVLPTPPPIPDAILRSIEYNRAHPEPQTPQQPQRFVF